MLALKDLVLKCAVRMVHIIHCCSPDQVCTVKPALSDHSKIDKTNVLKTNGRLMKVESIAECSLGAFCNTFDLH